MVPLAGLLDVAFLGHLAQIQHLAGVALATIVFNYLYWSLGFLRMGTTGMTAQAVGQQDQAEVSLILWRNLAIALTLGLLILGFQQPLQWLGFSLLSATAPVKAAGLAYFQAMVWGAPATLLNYVVLGWLLGKGESARVLLLSIVSNGTNVALNYWLIVRLGWASAGAGYATAASQYLMLLLGMAMLIAQFQGANWRALIGQLWQPQKLRAIFVLNRDIFVRTFALLSAFAMFSNISSAISAEALALNTLLLQVIAVTAYFIDGFAYATETCSGQLYGRNDEPQLKRLLRGALMLGVTTGLVCAGLFNLQSGYLFRLLTSHQSLIEQSSDYALWLFPILGFGAIAYVLDGYFLGRSAGRVLRNSTLIAAFLGFMPMALLGWKLQNVQILWFAMTMFMATRAITLSLQLKRSMQSQS
ncbi:MATE family efflux transporter [filamentous cyanobacterium LEGE 11480]|uniref:MATE family efflux transporter n=2 Tax=Romeriopsis TaxID=2992131 RepID=A0A928Z497_9CYAN|nr:MATE family efflux transporter [Romeriopsis navalis LEGE 11480]